jgi:hypothetical protein
MTAINWRDSARAIQQHWLAVGRPELLRRDVDPSLLSSVVVVACTPRRALAPRPSVQCKANNASKAWNTALDACSTRCRSGYRPHTAQLSG